MSKDQIDKFLASTASLQAEEILAWASEQFSPRIAFASSMGPEDQGLTDIIARQNLPIAIFTLDTGRLPQETYDLIDVVAVNGQAGVLAARNDRFDLLIVVVDRADDLALSMMRRMTHPVTAALVVTAVLAICGAFIQINVMDHRLSKAEQALRDRVPYILDHQDRLTTLETRLDALENPPQ